MSRNVYKIGCGRLKIRRKVIANQPRREIQQLPVIRRSSSDEAAVMSHANDEAAHVIPKLEN